MVNENGIRILIADDHPHVRSALRLLLQETLGVIVVGEANDLEQALELVRMKQPDLALLDWELLAPDSAAALTGLRTAHPNLAVIALSGHPGVRQQALRAGADAFFSRGDPPERLVSTVNSCHRSESKGDKK
jgi:DNA-binding NarL/FixJ family response regulator